MGLRVHNDRNRFKEIIRGKIKSSLKDYIKKGEFISKQGNEKVTVPISSVDLPRFRFGDQSHGGVGQGQGEEGDSVGGKPEEGDGAGKAGKDSAEHALDVEVSLDEMAEMLGEELELPNIEPKGSSKLKSKKIKYKTNAKLRWYTEFFYYHLLNRTEFLYLIVRHCFQDLKYHYIDPIYKYSGIILWILRI